jgi:hypothetical protein
MVSVDVNASSLDVAPLVILSCADFGGTLQIDLKAVRREQNSSLVLAKYNCWTGSEFAELELINANACQDVTPVAYYLQSQLIIVFDISEKCKSDAILILPLLMALLMAGVSSW